MRLVGLNRFRNNREKVSLGLWKMGPEPSMSVAGIQIMSNF